MSYNIKLSDPRWQKRRLKILERDNWGCVRCGAKEKTLHVHHLKYVGEPWDAPDDKLQTLCEDCHYQEHPTNVPKLSELKSTRLQLLEKVEDASASPSAINAWKQAIIIIDAEAERYYGIDLKNEKDAA